MTSRGVGRPPLISHSRVLACAMAIVDGEGLAKLTMRRLGTVLGVDPMSVYRHVKDKAALYDGLVEQVYSEVALPEPTGDWTQDFYALARSLRRTMLAHPNAVPLLGTRPPVSVAGFRIMEAGLNILLTAGLQPQDAADAVDCAARLVVGHVLAEVGQVAGGVEPSDDAHEWSQHRLPADQWPGLAALTRAGVRHDPERLFEFSLHGIALTLATRLDAPSEARPHRPRDPVEGARSIPPTRAADAVEGAAGG